MIQRGPSKKVLYEPKRKEDAMEEQWHFVKSNPPFITGFM